MTTLQTRLAQADKPTRELLEEVWEAIHGRKPARKRCGSSPENRFNAMLDAEAWPSAVEMLVGEGWRIYYLDSSIGGRATYKLIGPEVPDDDEPYIMVHQFASGTAKHKDNALAIACLKARGL